MLHCQQFQKHAVALPALHATAASSLLRTFSLVACFCTHSNYLLPTLCHDAHCRHLFPRMCPPFISFAAFRCCAADLEAWQRICWWEGPDSDGYLWLMIDFRAAVEASRTHGPELVARVLVSNVRAATEGGA